MLKLLSTKAQGCKHLRNTSKPWYVGIHWKALAEYPQISTICQGFSHFISFSHHFVLAELATTSIKVNPSPPLCIFSCLIYVYDLPVHPARSPQSGPAPQQLIAGTLYRCSWSHDSQTEDNGSLSEDSCVLKCYTSKTKPSSAFREVPSLAVPFFPPAPPHCSES